MGVKVIVGGGKEEAAAAANFHWIHSSSYQASLHRNSAKWNCLLSEKLNSICLTSPKKAQDKYLRFGGGLMKLKKIPHLRHDACIIVSIVSIEANSEINFNALFALLMIIKHLFSMHESWWSFALWMWQKFNYSSVECELACERNFIRSR